MHCLPRSALIERLAAGGFCSYRMSDGTSSSRHRSTGPGIPTAAKKPPS